MADTVEGTQGPSVPAVGKKRVMVAIDESEFSYQALEWALDNLAGSLLAGDSPPLLIFTAQPISNLSSIPAATYGSAPPELIQSLQEHQKRLSLALLERARDISTKKGVNAEVVTEVGEPKVLICEAVEKYKVSLLVMGSHGRGAFQRAFLGSVSNYCVNNAKCPVLIVKKPSQ